MNLACTNCGANLDVDGSTQTPTCAFCKTRNVLPDDVWHRFRPQPSPLAPFLPAPEKKDNSNMLVAIAAVGVGGIALVGLSLVIMRQPAQPASPQKSGEDRAYAAPNDPCGSATAACARDRKMLLHCDGQKLVPALACKGPNGCRATNQGESVNCDYTYADENDPCNVSDSACSMDKKSELRCDGTKFVRVSTCGGSDGCIVVPASAGYTLTCDDHVADVDAPCLEDGRTACSTDMKSLLRCTHGHFALAAACAVHSGSGSGKPCAVAKDPVTGTTTIDCDQLRRVGF